MLHAACDTTGRVMLNFHFMMLNEPALLRRAFTPISDPTCSGFGFTFLPAGLSSSGLLRQFVHRLEATVFSH
jgi:hypothetical protein